MHQRLQMRERNLRRRFAMPRRLISIIQYVKEAQEQGQDLHSLYIDESDVVQLDQEDNEEEE